MSNKHTTKKSRTDWQRLRRMRDSDIDLSDAPAMDAAFFRRAKIRKPTPKQAVSIRIDRDVLDWFKSRGEGYQTRINEVLRAHVKKAH